MKKPRILVILGPTATGKSDLAVRLAKEFNGEIISADSRQVYKGLDIGTGKITKKEMCGIKHYLLDVASPKNRFSVVKYVALAETAIAGILNKGKLPIICGGTGFYIEALVDGVVLPDVPANEMLRKKLSMKTAQQLITMLRKLDPARANKIDKLNRRRIIRAIEIATALGVVPKPKKVEKYDPIFIGLNLSSEALRVRIETRLIKRIKHGMITEAKQLHEKGLSWKRMYELGLEYRYLSMFLQDRITKTEMIRLLNTEIWHYAKRQMTWFKRDQRIKWFDVDETLNVEKYVDQTLL